MLSISNKLILALFICLITTTIGGCGYYANRKQQEYQRQEREARLQKEKEHLESLQPCSSTEWFDRCNPNFIPHYRSVVVHIKPWAVKFAMGEEDPMYFYEDAKRFVIQLLEKKGYVVFIGRDLENKEYIENVEACSVISKYTINLVVKNSLTEVIHHEPLFMKLKRENNNWSGYDAVLFLEYNQVAFESTTCWRVRFELFDNAENRIVMWTDNYGLRATRKKEFGRPYTEIVGNKIYQKRPYWYKNSIRDVLEEAIQNAFDYLPSWSGDSLISQEFDELKKLNCRLITPILIWQ